MITVILTGGKSRRMGRDKAALEMDGTTMSLRLADRFASMGEVAFSVDRPGRFPVGAYREFVDRYPGQGPLNGLVSAFYNSAEEFVLLLATDMPAVTPEAAETLLSSIGEHDVCLFGDEPLFALYRRSCLNLAEEQLAFGQNAVYGFLNRVDVLSLPKPEEALFANLNTPEDLRFYCERTGQ